MVTTLNCKYLYSVPREVEGTLVNKSVMYVDLIATEFTNPQPKDIHDIEGFNKTCICELTEFAQGSVLVDIVNKDKYIYAYIDGEGKWLLQ